MLNFPIKNLKLSSIRLQSSLAIMAIATLALGGAMTPSLAKADGFYGQIDLGLGVVLPSGKSMTTKSTTLESVTKPSESDVPNSLTSNVRGLGSFLSLGIGYSFSDYLALDLNFQGRTLPSEVTDKNGQDKSADNSNETASMVLMPKVHGYYPLGEKTRIGAFVGAGYAINRLRQELTSDGDTSTFEGTQKVNFAWTAGLEWGYLLENNVRLNVTTGYTDLGRIEWNNRIVTTSPVGSNYSTVTRIDRYSLKLSSIDLTVGVALPF